MAIEQLAPRPRRDEVDPCRPGVDQVRVARQQLELSRAERDLEEVARGALEAPPVFFHSDAAGTAEMDCEERERGRSDPGDPRGLAERARPDADQLLADLVREPA